MGRRSKLTDDQAREIATRAEKVSYNKLAQEYGVSKTTISRVVDRFAAPEKGVGITGEFGVSGLNRFGGSIQEDYLADWNSLSRMAKIIKRMQDHPIIASILFAVEMTVRGAQWRIKPAGESPSDQRASEFLESCMDDMSHTWDDHITQAMSMVPWGFSPHEIVYKRRLGQHRDPASKYDDGLIGWRKFAFRAQETLAPGHEWEFDEHGGVQAMNQQAPPDYKPLAIPIDRLLLYRTTSAKNNPQGRSLLRGSYTAWYFAKQFAEIEGIAAERMGAGLPVMYLGDGTSKSGANSDFEKAKIIVRDTRADEQAGLVIPHPKMTSDGKGALFELVSPPSRGIVDFEQAIQRYHQQIAQTLLAQFLFFGLTERGTQALAVRSTDFFSEAISGLLESIVQTLNRHAVSRLFALNAGAFPDVEAWPEIEVGPIGQLDVSKVVTAVVEASRVGLIHPDEGIERTLRQVLELPEREEPEDTKAPERTPETESPRDTSLAPESGVAAETEAIQAVALNGAQVTAAINIILQVTQGQLSFESGLNSLQILFGLTRQQAIQMLQGAPRNKKPTVAEEGFMSFADTRGTGAQKLRPWEMGTNAFQIDLAQMYDKWSRDLARAVAMAEDEEERDEIVTAALATLSAQMKPMVQKNIRLGMNLGLGDRSPTPTLLRRVAEIIAVNEAAIEASLVPAIQQKIETGLRDPDILASGLNAIVGLLAGFNARLESYAGGMWTAIQQGLGDASQQAAEETGAEKVKVYWRRDPQAKHCDDCLEYGDREYDSFEAMLAETGNRVPGEVQCDGNCRCALEYEQGGSFQRFHAKDTSPIKALEAKVDQFMEQTRAMRREPVAITLKPEITVQMPKQDISIQTPDPKVTVQLPRQAVTVNLPEMRPDIHSDVHVPVQPVTVRVDMPAEEVVEQEIQRDKEGFIQRIVKRVRRGG